MRSRDSERKILLQNHTCAIMRERRDLRIRQNSVSARERKT